MKKLLKGIDISLGIIFMIWLIGFIGFWLYAESLRVPDKSYKTDAVVVFTGGPDRVNIGLDLLKFNKTRHLFISGAGENVRLEDIYNHWPSYDPAEDLCCIKLGFEAKDTAGNAEEMQNWLDTERVQSVRLVTAQYHMPRARLELLKKASSIQTIYHPVRSAKEKGNTWRSIKIWVGEYNKTIVSFMKWVLS